MFFCFLSVKYFWVKGFLILEYLYFNKELLKIEKFLGFKGK